MASPPEMENLRGAIESCEGALRWANDAVFMESLPEEARNIFRSGVIQCFEVAYDECRKSIQKWLRESDIPLRGNLFRDAGSAELIDDVEKWMEFRIARNQTSHFYSVDFAQRTFSLISDFLPLARQLLRSLEERNEY